MAYVVRKAGVDVDAQQIRTVLLGHVEAQRLSKFAVPESDRIAFVAAIPKTSVGKIDKKLLREKKAA